MVVTITRKGLLGTLGWVAAVALLLVGCTDQATYVDKNGANDQLLQYQKAQPAPKFDWSQYRQTLISVETAQVNGTATTSFFFNQGVKEPVRVCPSIGYAMPSTAQLTNPLQSNGSGVAIGQMENTGVYTGDSTGTYVVCVINGVAAPVYWEGFVETEPGPARWDSVKGMVIAEETPTVKVETKR